MRRRRSLRRDVQAIAAVVSLAAAGSMTGVTGLAPASADTCTAPIARDVVVTQGLPSYTLLANGKSTMVKFFLSQPNSTDCTGKSMRITGGTLTVSRSDGSSSTVTNLLTPAAGSLATVPLYGTIQNTAPGDPVFLVDGSLMKLAGSTSAFSATFSASLTYAVTDSTGATTTGTLPVSTNPTTGAAISKNVGSRSKPIRVLVVPMGDGNSSTPQWDSAANDDVVNGMVALNRAAPVADGVSDLGGTGGVQYRISSSLLNLGSHVEYVNGLPTIKSYMTGGLFCGTGVEYSWVANQLNSLLSSWNSQNPSATADRALGVVSEKISIGPITSSQNCSNGSSPAEGIAGLGGQFAWVRATAPSTTAPGSGTRQGTTGAVAGLELLHTYGGSTQNSTTYHSTSTYADGAIGDTGRAANLATHAFLGTNNRALMHFGLSPWDDYITLYERPDWDYLGCALRLPPGSNISSSCGGTITSATNGTSAATGGLILAGTTDGTVAGTDAFTYFDSNQPIDGRDDSSAYRLVEYDPLNVKLADIGVRVVTQESTHNGSTLDATSTAPLSFGVALPANQQDPLQSVAGRTSRFELQKVSSTGSRTVLYARALNAPPTFVSTSDRSAFGGAVNYSNDAASSAPAVSADGRYIARSKAGSIQIAPGNVGNPLYAASVAGQQAAWSRDGKALAVVNNGNVSTYPVTYTSGVPSLGAPTSVYSTVVPQLQPSASDPVFVPTTAGADKGLVFAIGGKLVEVDLTSGLLPISSVSCTVNGVLTPGSVPPCTYLTTSGSDSHPSLNQGADTLAFQRGPSGSSNVWTLLLANAAQTQVQRIAAAGSPAYAGPDLVVTTPAGLKAYGSSSYASPTTVTSASTDSVPSSSQTGAVVAFQRGSDVWLATSNQRSVSVTVSGTAGQDYRLSVFRKSADGTTDPVLVNVHGTSSGSTTTFTVTYPDDRVPDGSATMYVVTDGFVTATKLEAGQPGGGLPTASVNIYAPEPGATILSHTRIPVAGGATDSSGHPASALTWTLTGPGAYTNGVVLGSGATLPDLDPGTAGWAAGSYVLRATYTDPVAGAVTKSEPFTIVKDTDGDGIPDTLDSSAAYPCFPSDAVTNPSNAQADPDGDLIPSIVDPDPCTSSVNMDVNFTPTTSGGSSSGNVVKAHVASTALDVTKATTSNTFITSIGGFQVRIPAVAIQVSSGTITASFDRNQYLAAVQMFALGLQTTPVVVQIYATPVSGYGFDPNAPTNV